MVYFIIRAVIKVYIYSYIFLFFIKEQVNLWTG